MPFEFGGFKPSKGFEFGNFNTNKWKPKEVNPYRASDGRRLESEINFYNQDSLWTRWRRGYEIYTTLQNLLDEVDSDCPVEYRTKHLKTAM